MLLTAFLLPNIQICILQENVGLLIFFRLLRRQISIL